MTEEQYTQVKRFGRLAGDVFPEGGYDVHRNDDGSILLSLFLSEENVRGKFPAVDVAVSDTAIKEKLGEWRSKLVGLKLIPKQDAEEAQTMLSLSGLLVFATLFGVGYLVLRIVWDRWSQLDREEQKQDEEKQNATASFWT